MKRYVMWLCAVPAVVAGLAVGQMAPDVALEAAMRKETVDGDLEGAIQQYLAIAKGADRAAAAKALLRAGRCYEKLGDAQAAKVYERVVNEFPGEKEAVQEARARLAARNGFQSRAGAPRRRSIPVAPGTAVGWYNGDWRTGKPGLANWYLSKGEYARVYDDFTVPEGGWTVVAVFSNNGLYGFPPVTQASWEIRTGMAPGKRGKVVASGVGRATQTQLADYEGTRAEKTQFRIQVDGLNVKLPAGEYWLSVAPCGRGKGYANSTVGVNAVGTPPGNNGRALFSFPEQNADYVLAESIGPGGQLGHATDFSQGVIVAAGAR